MLKSHRPLAARFAQAAAVLAFSALAAQAQNALTYVPVISTFAGSGVSGNTGDNGQATLATFGNPVSVNYDLAGNAYVTDKGKGTVRKITPAGIIATLAGTGTVGAGTDGVTATASKLNGPNESWIDPVGNLYIADTTNNRIRKVTIPAGSSTGIITTIAGNGTAGFAGDGAVESSTTMISGPNAVCVDIFGNVIFGDSGSQRIRKIDATTGIISTIAGNGTGTDTGDGGLATAATIAGPRYLFPDIYGNLFLVDRTNHVVREILASTGFIKTVAGNKTTGSSGDGAAATSAAFNTPNAVAVDALGNLYIVDATPNTLRVVNAASGTVYTLAGGNTTAGYTGDGGLSTSATLSGPLGVGVSLNGTVDVGDAGNFVVRRLALGNNFPATSVGTISAAQKNGVEAISAATVASFGLSHAAPADFIASGACALPAVLLPDGVCAINASFAPTAPGVRTSQLLAIDGSGNQYFLGLSGIGNAPAVAIGTGIIGTVAGTGTAGSTGDGAAATAAKLTAPAGLALDAVGNLYLADTADHKVRLVSAASGNISTIAGTGTAGAGGDGGPATAATLSAPTGLVIDPTGNLYISDTNNAAIRVISANTAVISTVPGTTGVFSAPKGLGIDAAGLNLYVADSGNNVIRKVNLPTGYISVVAGTVGSSGFSGDNGAATSATLKSPGGVTLDTSGNLYIADTGNNVVRKVTAATGLITTIAGTGTAGSSGDGKAATLAALSGPTRVAVDAAGDLYLADAGNNKVRYVSAATGLISTVAGSGSTASPFTGDGGVATTATLNAPSDVVLDQFADVVIADTSDNRIASINGKTTKLNLGSADPNTTTATQTATVTNFGNLPLTFSKLVVSANFTQVASGGTDCSAGSNTAPNTTTLAAGASCLIALTFTPTASVTYNGTVTLTDNALNNAASTQAISLTGIGNSVAVPAKLAVTAGNNQTTPPLDTYPTNLQATVTDNTGAGIAGASVTFTAPSSGATGTFANGTNTVTVKSGAGGIATATAFTAGPTRGNVSITASLSSPALSTTFTEVIAGNPTPAVVVSTTPASPQVYGQAITVKATLTPSALGSTNAGGTVTFLDNNVAIPNATVGISSGVASFAYTPSAGSHSYSATYGGDGNFSSSASTVNAPFTVTPLGITVAGNSITLPYGTSPSPTLTGTLTGVLAADTGSVSATYTAGITSTSNAGTYNISASLTGSSSANYTVTSTSGTVTIIPVGTSNTVATSNTNPGVGTSVTLTDTVVANIAPFAGTYSGSVAFYDGGTSGTLLATRTVGVAGNATLAIATLGLGTHTITAVYTPSANFTGVVSSSNSVTIFVATPDFSLTLSKSSGTIKQGQQAQVGFSYATVGGFVTTISPTCTGLPANATCTFTPASFTPTLTATTQTGLLQITTAGPSQTASIRPFSGVPLLAALFGIGFLAVCRRHAISCKLALLALLLCGLVTGLTGCGSSTAPLSKAVTPTGTSTIVVTATAGTAVHTATYTLTVTADQ